MMTTRTTTTRMMMIERSNGLRMPLSHYQRSPSSSSPLTLPDCSACPSSRNRAGDVTTTTTTMTTTGRGKANRALMGRVEVWARPRAGVRARARAEGGEEEEDTEV
eukprot:3847398-Rhodomonas_salina.1